jgi:hypothetical protein
MTAALRTLLAAVGVALAAGLALHVVQFQPPLGDRIIAAGLVALVAIPVINLLVVLAEELKRQ